jgi:hypothetical protein
MGISLTGLTPSTTYDALIKVGDNGPIDGTLKTLSDGLGNDLPVQASTTAVNFTATLTQSGTALQPVLVSGTNIKTINGTSLLGSGNIVTPSTPPSGVSGAIQFSNGSAFASDAANLFWDDSNNRLGVGTNAPAHSLSIETGSAFSGLSITSSNNSPRILLNGIGGGYGIIQNVTGPLYIDTPSGSKLISRGGGLQINGQGSTSATTSLLVQNSAGSSAFSIKDDGYVTAHVGFFSLGALTGVNVAASNIMYNAKFWNQSDGGTTIGAQAAPAASAILDIRSTTSGVLFPRMTTTQKNAIATPAAGLVVYDSTTNKLCCYNGSTWNDLF